MKKILILYPHFPPSNLAGVHRPRLFAQHLPSFEWEPVVLTVHEKYYEEAPDYNLVKLLPPNLRIEKVNAFRVTRPRLIGDIGLRAFLQLYRRARQLIRQEQFDFLYIPVPSFYCALLGRLLHRATGIRYGIDYIDPWVHHFPGSEKKWSRHWLSTQLAKTLEPIAIKNVSLITGVAAGYYQGVIDRNPQLLQQAVFGAMPYGGEKRDHQLLAQLQPAAYLFTKQPGKIQLIYAGAMLPKAYAPLEAVFKAITANKNLFRNVELIFIGTGKLANDPMSHNIKPLAEAYGLWQTVVFEYPQRIAYLDVLAHLQLADGAFILGSTEPHYTPSKVYQAVLSEKPVLAILHIASTATSVIEQSNAGVVLAFDGEAGVPAIESSFAQLFEQYLAFFRQYNPAHINTAMFEQYSAQSVTAALAGFLDQAVQLKP